MLETTNHHANRIEGLSPAITLNERFEMLDYLGRDRYCNVFRAFDHKEQASLGSLSVSLILRVLREDRTYVANTRAVLIGKIGALRRVSHKNILQVFDYVEGADFRGITQEWADGDNLALRVMNARLTAATIKNIIYGTALALEELHAHGLVHGDLAIDQIFFDKRSGIKLSPLGLRDIVDANQSKETSKPLYCRPEFSDEPFAKWDRGADVYALGAIARELLYRSGFLGRNIPVVYLLRNLLAAVHLLPRGKDNETARLLAIVHKATARNPDERYASVSEMRVDLEKFADLRALKPDVSQPPVRQATRHLPQERQIPQPNPRRANVVVAICSLYFVAIVIGIRLFLAPFLRTFYLPPESKEWALTQPSTVSPLNGITAAH